MPDPAPAREHRGQMSDAMAIDWRDISYLARGNTRQRRAYRALQSLGVFDILRLYSPVLAGTIPLDIDVEQSDLDIICEVGATSDLTAFERAVKDTFGAREDFQIERTTVKGMPTVFARFTFDGLPVEIFGQPRPVTEQNAYRHMVVEARLLSIGGQDARRAIRQMRRAGLKTEPAFARYFDLAGDPYEALLELSFLEDDELLSKLKLDFAPTHACPNRYKMPTATRPHATSAPKSDLSRSTISSGLPPIFLTCTRYNRRKTT